jgi:hypothetical protein
MKTHSNGKLQAAQGSELRHEKSTTNGKLQAAVATSYAIAIEKGKARVECQTSSPSMKSSETQKHKLKNQTSVPVARSEKENVFISCNPKLKSQNQKGLHRVGKMEPLLKPKRQKTAYSHIVTS